MRPRRFSTVPRRRAADRRWHAARTGERPDSVSGLGGGSLWAVGPAASGALARLQPPLGLLRRTQLVKAARMEPSVSVAAVHRAPFCPRLHGGRGVVGEEHHNEAHRVLLPGRTSYQGGEPWEGARKCGGWAGVVPAAA